MQCINLGSSYHCLEEISQIIFLVTKLNRASYHYLFAQLLDNQIMAPFKSKWHLADFLNCTCIAHHNVRLSGRVANPGALAGYGCWICILKEKKVGSSLNIQLKNLSKIEICLQYFWAIKGITII